MGCLNGSSRERTAQIMRAVLLAIATVASRTGFFARIDAVHGSTRSGREMAALTRDVIAITSSFRRYLFPILDIRPSRSFPPDDLLIGVSPTQAAKSRPVLNCSPLPIVATIAEALIGPTPGMVCRSCTRLSFRATRTISFSTLISLSLRSRRPGHRRPESCRRQMVHADHVWRPAACVSIS